MNDFDDALLEGDGAADDPTLRYLAGAGARIRRESSSEPLGRLDVGVRPRGVIALGAEARLIRAVLEPVCPAPFVAWPAEGLPGWVGPLDLVIVLGAQPGDRALLASAHEAVRRGASLIVAAPPSSELAEMSASRSTLLVPTGCEDATAAAVAVLAILHRMGLGPVVIGEHVAEAADLVAEASSPRLDLAHNPAKALALAMADDLPLIWGGTVLAARASRRVAEAVREVTGRGALAVDADDLFPLLERLEARDPFADPFDDPVRDRFPVLVVLEDRAGPLVVQRTQIDIVSHASSRGVRVHTLSAGADDDSGSEVSRYVTLLQQGLYGAAYLALGLGR